MYHRFWIGWKKYENSVKDFDKVISDVFAPATTVTGQDKGLKAYQPALIENGGSEIKFGNEGKSFILPDEITLVSYQDLETYRAIRETPKGSVYGPVHGDFFQLGKNAGPGTRSHSTVPTEFKGTVDFKT
jgi:hypothetical protein